MTDQDPIPVVIPEDTRTPEQQRLDQIRDILAKIETHTNPTKEQGPKQQEKKETTPSLGKGLKEYVGAIQGLLSTKSIGGLFSGLKNLTQATVGVGRAALEKFASEEPKKKPKSAPGATPTASPVAPQSVSKSVSNVTSNLSKLMSEAWQKSTTSTSTSAVNTIANATSNVAKVASTSTSAVNTIANATSNVAKVASTSTDDQKQSTSTHTSTTQVMQAVQNVAKNLKSATSEAGSVASGGVSAAGGVAEAGGGVAAEAGGVAATGAVAGGEAAGGAGAAAGGVGAALASNPVGWVIAVVAAIVAVGVALVALPFLIKNFGESLLESQRKLAESSGAMAQVFAKKDVADIQRDTRVGDATAGSAGGLSEALIRLEDRIEPFTILVSNFLNDVMTGFVNFATGMLDAIIAGINMIIRGINSLPGMHDALKEIVVNTTPKTQQSDFGNWIGEWNAAANGYRGQTPGSMPSGPPVTGRI